MLKAIIFDMDGVLINSTKYIHEAHNSLLKKSGIKIDEKETKRCLGLSLRDKLLRWKKEYGLVYELKDFAARSAEIQFKLMQKEFKKDKELRRFLSEVKKNNIKLAIGTGSGRLRAEMILKAMDIRKYLDVIVTADEVENHKPHPDIFLKAAKKLGVNPKDCVVFEDAADGVSAAKKGKMKAVAMKTVYATNKELKDADLIIKGYKDIDVEKLKRLW
jgi:beta-phosphoglucomutase family hydrolase